MLELVEATLNQMALLVQFLIIGAWLGSILAGRNDCCRFTGLDEGYESVTIISPVGNHVLAVKVSQQRLSLGDVMTLPGREQQMQRIAQGIYQEVDLGGESTATATQGLRCLPTVFWAAPAAAGWARTTVLSGSTLSMSASSLK